MDKDDALKLPGNDPRKSRGGPPTGTHFVYARIREHMAKHPPKETEFLYLKSKPVSSDDDPTIF